MGSFEEQFVSLESMAFALNEIKKKPSSHSFKSLGSDSSVGLTWD